MENPDIVTADSQSEWHLEAVLEKLEQTATKDAKLIVTLPNMSPDEHGELSRAVAMGSRVHLRIAEIEPQLPLPRPGRISHTRKDHGEA